MDYAHDTGKYLAKTDNQRVILEGWRRALAGEYSLIHSIGPDRGVSPEYINTRSPFFIQPVNKLIAGWDVISTSVINYSKCKHDVDGGSGRGCLHINLELNVPVQNIIGTHTYNVAFPNHAGRFNNLPSGAVENPYSLVDALNKIVVDDIPYNNLVEFNYLRHEMSRQRWSEVLVIGKSGVNVYSGLQPTQPVTLKAIHYYPVEIYNAVVDDSLKKLIEDYVFLLSELMKINSVKCFNFTLEHKRHYCKAIRYLYDVLVSEFGSPRGGSLFYLHGRRHSTQYASSAEGIKVSDRRSSLI